MELLVKQIIKMDMSFIGADMPWLRWSRGNSTTKSIFGKIMN
jgi:hypothetical protein